MSFETTLAESSPAESTSPETTATPESVTPGQSPTDVEQGGQRQSEAVPYERFQQVNSELSALKQEAQAAGYSNVRDYVQALQEAASAAYNYEQETEADPIQALEQRLNQQSEILAEQLFTTQFAQMKQQYPQADANEVKRSLIYGEARDLKTAVERNHQSNEAKRQAAIAEYNRTQQQRQNSAVEGAGGGSTGSGQRYDEMSRADFLKLKEGIINRKIAPPG